MDKTAKSLKGLMESMTSLEKFLVKNITAVAVNEQIPTEEMIVALEGAIFYMRKADEVAERLKNATFESLDMIPSDDKTVEAAESMLRDVQSSGDSSSALRQGYL